jgi:ketosteroid isomerase-like protein
MPSENVEVALRQLEAASERDLAGLTAAWAEDVALVVHWQGGGLSGTAPTGRIAVVKWFEDWLDQFDPGYRLDIEETHEAGDRVVVLATHRGRGRHSGVTVEQRAAHVYTLREGKVSRIEVWGDRDARAAALEAVGLGE